MSAISFLCRLLPLAAALFFNLPAAADDSLETPGVPPKDLPAQAQGKPPSWAGKAAHQGVVSVSHPLAAEAGARALERGGNAIDAAAAIQLVLNVVEPQFSGIGGGGFMKIHLASSGETTVVDSRERAPAAATPDMFAPGGVALSLLHGVDQRPGGRRSRHADGRRHCAA